MKILFSTLLLASAFAHADVLIGCQFVEFGHKFIPNSTLTTSLSRDVGNMPVYEVEYISLVAAPVELAFVKDKTIQFFNMNENETGIQLINHKIVVGGKIARDTSEGTVTYTATFKSYDSWGMEVNEKGMCLFKN